MIKRKRHKHNRYTHKSLGKDFPRKGIVCRLYMSDEQLFMFLNHSGCVRFVYNYLLGFITDAYIKKIDAENEAEFLAECDCQFKGVPKPERIEIDEEIIENAKINEKNFNRILKKLKIEFPWLSNCNQKVLYEAVHSLMRAFDNFFKQPGKFGYPKFKKKKSSKKSCHFNSQCFSGIDGNRVSLTGDFQDMRFDCSKRDMSYLNKYQDYIQDTTVSITKSGKILISFNVGDFEADKKYVRDNVPASVKEMDFSEDWTEIETEEEGIEGCYLKITDKSTGEVRYKKAVGLDLGLKEKAIDSDGNHFQNQKFLKKLEKKRRRLARSFSKKKVRSRKYAGMKDYEIPKNSPDAGRNREKARIKLAKIDERIANLRRNDNEQITTKLVVFNDLIIKEDLAPSNMMKNHKLAKAIQDAGWGQIDSLFEQKATRHGRVLIRVDRFYPSSRLCPECKEKNEKLELKDRAWICPHCGHVVEDRDENAANNLLHEGVRMYKEMLGDGYSISVIRITNRVESVQF